MRKSLPLILVTFLLYVFLYLPLLVVVISSFNSARFGTEWKGFTLEWYRSAFRDPQVLTALKNTLLLGFCSAVIATILGTLLGYGMARHSFRAKGIASRLLLFPMAVPDIVMAVSLLIFYAFVRAHTGLFHLGLGTMIVSHVTFQIPFVALIIRARLRDFDLSIEEAAADLGASSWRRLRHITLPMLRPGIIAAALLAFTLSLDDFVVSFFTSGPGFTTVPIYIYSTVKRGLTGEVHALSALLLFGALLGTVAAAILTGARKKERPP